jgi:uncharacterized 2Fe-2S/4Fe-4S cluster protein (DUF4445 family)
MDVVRLTLINEGREQERDVPRGTTLLSGLQGFEGFEFDAPCGGKGTCGKCKVLVEGEVSPAGETERGFLGPSQLERGVRLSCLARAEGACRVTPLFSSSGAAILTRRFDFSGLIDPPFKYSSCELPSASLEDQRSDAERFSAFFAENDGLTPSEIPISLIRALPGLLREYGNRLRLCRLAGVPWALLPPDAGAGFGIAVDIGTTTIVAYLIDLADGRTAGLVSGMNMQKSHGGDVISRVQAAIDSGPGPLARIVRGQLTGMIFRLMEEAELAWEELRGVSVAGNTVMMHLFAEVDPRHIAVSPFIPVFCELRIESSSELLSRLPARVPVIMLPSVSGFIGADISAGILATGLKEREKPALLIDIGTNGELVLGNRDRIVACSTAAGPAFEGATISRGVGGIHGAIDTLRIEGGDLEISTIGNAPPLGICGSGIIDLTAILVSLKIVDETGRLLPPEELPSGLPEGLRERVSQEGFLVSMDRDGQPLYFTPGDVREVQLAKAAVAAGIDVLLEDYGIRAGDVDQVFLAGGFGSYIDTAGAAGIGLLPAELLDRVQPAGNTAGAGAAEVLLSTQAFEKLQALTEGVQYIELSANLRFQQLFVDRMFFPAS